MFTGIIMAIGHLHSVQNMGQDKRLRIHAGALDLSRCHLGDSIAVNGVCLTVVALEPPYFSADLSLESLKRSTFGEKNAGEALNLETALTLSTPLGGHLVSGHVDGIATLRHREEDGRSLRFILDAPPELQRYIAAKGSVCLDGVSLTVNALHPHGFELNLVPHTLANTTLADLRVGAHLNLEVDLIARYLERLQSANNANAPCSLHLF